MNDDHIYYVYALIDPRNNLPFYIGKGKNDRCYSHLKETKENTDNKFKFNVINIIQSSGLDVIVKKLHISLDESTAYEIEEQLIDKFGRRSDRKDGILTNICPANRPPSPKGLIRSEETKRKIRDAQKGKTLSEEHKKNIQIAKENNLEKYSGRKHSTQSIEKMRNAKIGKKHTKEHIANSSSARKGKNTGADNHFYGKLHTIDTKNKMSESLTGKIRTIDFKENLSKLYKGIPKEKVECPHCHKEGGLPQMKRYHFDNCKEKIQ